MSLNHSPALHCGAWLVIAWLSLSVRSEEIALTVDFSVSQGKIRALQGINKGPLAPGGMIDVTREQTELGIPFTRLHDCGWPNPYVVDHHVVFPDPQADPELPESYDFRLTDEYLNAVVKTGSEPIYRLGESIEHTSVKRFVHPPADRDKWAAICVGIIRHYNEGWANGFHHRIRYWEIWNEPENRPAMWSGTDEDYLQLYRTAALAIKRKFPDLLVGGPALGASGNFLNGQFVPTGFALDFLSLCRRDKVPLNFFSWHCYTADPTELGSRSRAIRRLLDDQGFPATESHLNEWNYLPGNTWQPIAKSEPAQARQRYFEAMAGAKGAAFIATSLVELQDAPVDVCNLFHGELGIFGIFNEHGVPQKSYQALRAFRYLLDTPQRVESSGGVAGKLAVIAGVSSKGSDGTILLSNFADPRSGLALGWKGFPGSGNLTVEVRTMDLNHDLTTVRTETMPSGPGAMKLSLPAPGLVVVQMHSADKQGPDPGR